MLPFSAVRSTSVPALMLLPVPALPIFCKAYKVTASLAFKVALFSMLSSSDCSVTFPPATMPLSFLIFELLITVTSPVAASALSFSIAPFSAISSMLPLPATDPSSMLPAAKTPLPPVPVLLTLPSSDCREILWLASLPLRTIILPLLLTEPLPRNTTSPFVASSLPEFVTAPLSASRLMPRLSAPSPAVAVMLPLFVTPLFPSKVTDPLAAVIPPASATLTLPACETIFTYVPASMLLLAVTSMFSLLLSSTCPVAVMPLSFTIVPLSATSSTLPLPFVPFAPSMPVFVTSPSKDSSRRMPSLTVNVIPFTTLSLAYNVMSLPVTS